MDNIIENAIAEQIKKEVAAALKKAQFDYSSIVQDVAKQLEKDLPRLIAQDLIEDRDWLYDYDVYYTISELMAKHLKQILKKKS